MRDAVNVSILPRVAKVRGQSKSTTNLLRVIRQEEKDEHSDDDRRNTFKDESTNVLRSVPAIPSRLSHPYSHCQP